MDKMVRTVISLPEGDKDWLDRTADERGVSMTEVVREAVHRLREEKERAAKPTFRELLRAAAGTWTQGDGLEWQLKLRKEWDERSP